jgi:hypothetical protein
LDEETSFGKNLRRSSKVSLRRPAKKSQQSQSLLQSDSGEDSSDDEESETLFDATKNGGLKV